MTKTHLQTFILVLAAMSLVAAGSPATAEDGGRPLRTTLYGGTETPDIGDPEGIGEATVRVNVGQKQICYDIQVRGIAVATMAHIHKAPPTSAGPVVVPLTPPSAGGSVSDCATVTQELAKEILQNPQDYYVNVHNAEFPGGAVRGQLSK